VLTKQRYDGRIHGAREVGNVNNQLRLVLTKQRYDGRIHGAREVGNVSNQLR
jgi:hypothetical protein